MNVQLSMKATIRVLLLSLLVSLIPLGYCTTETRYMRNDNVLGLTQTSSYREYSDIVDARVKVYWASDVAIYHVDTSETSLGVKVAQVFRSGSSSGIQSNTWDCAEQNLETNDAIRVRVYQKMGSSNWVLCAIFTTEELGETQLDEATWTFYYYTRAQQIVRPPLTEAWFYWGISTYDSRIENFCHSTPSEKEWHNISGWNFNLECPSPELDFPIGPILIRVGILITLNGEPMDKINITVSGGPSNLTFWKMTDIFGEAIVRLKKGTYLFYIRHDIYLVEHNISIVKHCTIHFELNSTEYRMVRDWSPIIEIVSVSSCFLGVLGIYAYHKQKTVSKQWKKIKSLKGKPKKEIEKLKGKR